MNLNALSVLAQPKTSSVLFGNTIEVVAQGNAQPGPLVSPVEVINNRVGCARYSQITNRLAQASPHWPPPPPLAGLRMLLPSLTDKSGYLVASSPKGQDDVIVPYFKWIDGMPKYVSDLWSVLDPVQKLSGLAAVDYHLFNVTDKTSTYYGLTFAIPVGPVPVATLGPQGNSNDKSASNDQSASNDETDKQDPSAS